MHDHYKWKRKAMAFAIRCHRHLWGKNNEDPLSFLHRRSISIDLARSLYLGWNKFGQKRRFDGWGLEGEGEFFIPPGIVFPHIRDKELLALFIISMSHPYDSVMLPGSDPCPVLLGPLTQGPDDSVSVDTASHERFCSQTTDHLLEGLSLLQAAPDCQVNIRVNTIPSG